MNTGEVVSGTEERLATGDAVNLAARLEQAAQPGEVLLGQETLGLVRDAVDVEQVPRLQLKGKSEPVPAYRLLAVEPRRAPAITRRRLDAPLVGREQAADTAAASDAFANVVERAGSCHLFTAARQRAGVGKSRLVDRSSSPVSVDEATVVRGRCLSYGEGITLLAARSRSSATSAARRTSSAPRGRRRTHGGS